MTDANKRIDTLAYLDQETVRVYDAVLGKCDQQVRQQLQQYRDQHEQHTQRWQEIASGMQGSTMGPTGQMKSMLQEHLQLAQDAADQDHALEALLLVERANLVELRRATEEQLPGDAAQFAQQCYQQEQEHVDYITQKLPAMMGISQEAHNAPTT